MHAIDVVWGDVKRDNVIVNSDGDAVVVDFGGSSTPDYLPPELRGTTQSDLLELNHMRMDLGLDARQVVEQTELAPTCVRI